MPLSQPTGPTFATVVSNVVGLINMIIPVLATLALVIFFIGLVQYIWNSGDSSGKEKGRELILWGLIALLVLFSIWGILALLQVAFFGGSSGRIGPIY